MNIKKVDLSTADIGELIRIGNQNKRNVITESLNFLRRHPNIITGVGLGIAAPLGFLGLATGLAEASLDLPPVRSMSMLLLSLGIIGGTDYIDRKLESNVNFLGEDIRTTDMTKPISADEVFEKLEKNKSLLEKIKQYYAYYDNENLSKKLEQEESLASAAHDLVQKPKVKAALTEVVSMTGRLNDTQSDDKTQIRELCFELDKKLDKLCGALELNPDIEIEDEPYVDQWQKSSTEIKK